MFSNKRKRINLAAQGSGAFFNFSTKDVFMNYAGLESFAPFNLYLSAPTK
jgi:hypothetical protein